MRKKLAAAALLLLCLFAGAAQAQFAVPLNADNSSCAWRVLEALLRDAGHHEAARRCASRRGLATVADLKQFCDERGVGCQRGLGVPDRREGPYLLCITTGMPVAHAVAVIEGDWVVDPNDPGYAYRWGRERLRGRAIEHLFVERQAGEMPFPLPK